MPVKYLLSIAFIALWAMPAFAQTTYFTNKGKPVKSLDSADYIRTITRIDTSATLYAVTETYKNGNIKCKGTSSKQAYIFWEGTYVDFYPSGKKKTEATYVANAPTGNYLEYFPNGSLYTTKQYIGKNDPLNKNSVGYAGYHYLIKTCNDLTGKPLITNGNGHYIGYCDDYKRSFEQGEVKDGERTGHWTGSADGKDSIRFEEDYDNGKLIKGISRIANGDVQTYDHREKNPEYTGGERAFAIFLRDNIRYPKEALQAEVQGRVLITFVVEKDGSLTDIKAIRAPRTDLAQEGIRVVMLSPKWVPGMQYGRPVRVQYTVPISFALQ